MFKTVISWWKLKQDRRAVKKYRLDFRVPCVFDHQLHPYGCPRNGELCFVEMKSGKTGIYKAHITKYWPGNTGQKDWVFEFRGYAIETGSKKDE